MSSPVLFLHAHPDDEAIFTGGTIVRLAAAGIESIVVFATSGEQGGSAAVREAETEQAGEILGLAAIEYLDYEDSGMAGDPANAGPRAFGSADVADAARRVAAIGAQAGAATVVTYDEWGIYGHPDHVKVHEVGVRAAAVLGVDSLYEATVDREYLHFVETHLVVEAGVGKRASEFGPGRLGLAAAPIGMPTVAITTTLDVRAVLEIKRQAMAAHASQIPETATVLHLPPSTFGAVYGYEWYVRRGPPGVLDQLVEAGG